jgi:hypothetical protein
MVMNEQETEAIAKAAIEYLISEGKEFEASLLLRSELSLNPTNWDLGFRLDGGEGEVQIADYAADLLVPPDILSFYRNGLTEERSGTIAGAIKEALQGCMGSDTFIRSIHVSAQMAVGQPFPEWRETYVSNLRGDNDPLNQGVVATRSALFSWNGLRFRSRTEAVMAAALAKTGALFSLYLPPLRT